MRSRPKRWQIAVIAGVVTVVGVATSVAVGAVSIGQQPAVTATPSTQWFGRVSLVRAVTSPDNMTPASTTTPTLIPGVATSVFIAAGHKAVLDMRYSAETQCSRKATTSSSGWCIVGLYVDGVEAAPATGDNYAIDSTDEGGVGINNAWQGHALERFITVGEGTHRIEARYSMTNTGITLWLGEQTLAVDYAP